jgi:hypothetical protein
VSEPEPTPEADEAARQTATARSRWLDPGWRTTALAWVDEEMARLGRRVIGAVEQPHIRPWSTALSIPTDAGLVWFKAGGPGTAYEASLLERLARWGTRGILEPLAVDPGRGWLLLPDGGTRLREMLDGGPGVDAWVRILGGYAAIQRGLAPRAPELISAGVPDLRPGTMPARLAALLEDPEVGLSATDRLRLEAILPAYADWCGALESTGIEASLQHDDLHDGNVFVGPVGDRIFDWGDSSVAYPFGTLLVTFRSIADRGLGDGAHEARALTRLRDAYLEPWTDRHARTELAEAASIAMRVAIVGRALSWQRSLAGIPLSDHGEWTGNVGGWLLELFEPAPL